MTHRTELAAFAAALCLALTFVFFISPVGAQDRMSAPPSQIPEAASYIGSIRPVSSAVSDNIRPVVGSKDILTPGVKPLEATETRVWGGEYSGRYLRGTDVVWILLENGKEFQIPQNRLTKPDRRWLKENIFAYCRKRALIVGVPSAPGYDDKPNVESDVNLMFKALQKREFEEICVLTPNSGLPELLPTKKNIEDAIDRMIADSHAEDALFFYFSGPGCVTDSEYYFIPSDVDKFNIKETAFCFSDLHRRLEKVSVNSKITVADVDLPFCNNQGKRLVRQNSSFSRSGVVKDVSHRPNFVPPEGTAFFYGCQEGESRNEDPLNRCGLFTKAFVDAFLGNVPDRRQRAITFYSVVEYAINTTTAQTGYEQTPQFIPGKGFIDLSFDPVVDGEQSVPLKKTDEKPTLDPVVDGEQSVPLKKTDEKPAEKSTLVAKGETKEDATVEPVSTTTDPVIIGPVRDFKAVSIGGAEYRFVRIPAGTFHMTTPDKDVTVPQYWMLDTEVPLKLWLEFAKEKEYKVPSSPENFGYDATLKQFLKSEKFSPQNAGFEQTDDHPVVEVAPVDAVAFCSWLTEKVNAGSGSDFPQLVCNLPTVSQWTYACLAGATTKYSFGDESTDLPNNANCGDVSFKNELSADQIDALQKGGWFLSDSNDGFAFTAPVRSYSPNAWGLYNMHGNVSEICRDDLSPSTEYSRCGGSLLESEQNCAAETRLSVPETQRGFYVGFRVVLTESQPDPDGRFQ
ncbi:MAG: SUMF1/EgtB/PvdO family nonheme iron enzyme [Thermoguttaceae bacterium]|nr:SUMF1/EgtB/PvdO family nonheme iron enzyme [Thermoguttaceae bacterium]